MHIRGFLGGKKESFDGEPEEETEAQEKENMNEDEEEDDDDEDGGQSVLDIKKYPWEIDVRNKKWVVNKTLQVSIAFITIASYLNYWSSSQIRRHCTVVPGGRVFSYSALILIGDGNGTASYPIRTSLCGVTMVMALWGDSLT